MKKRITLLLIVLITAGCIKVYGQTNPSSQSIPLYQAFTLVHSSTSYPVGWQGWTISTSPGSSFSTASPTGNNTMSASSDASSTNGSVHNYDGKIGFLNSASLDLAIVFSISTTGKSNIEVSWDIMTLRNPYDGGSNTRVNEVTLQYRVGTIGSFTTLTGVEYQNNTTSQISGTDGQKIESKSLVLPVACENEADIQLRFISREVSGSGARPSFAIDNVVVVDQASKPEDPAVQNLPFSQDFLFLTHNSTNLPNGFKAWKTGSPGSAYVISPLGSAETLSASGTASSASGAAYNFNGKIGFLNTASADYTLITAINTTAKTGIVLSYDLMTLRNPHDGVSNTRIHEISPQYRIGNTGVFKTIAGYEYQNNTTSQTSGTTGQKIESFSFTLPAECENQSSVQIRWISREVSGSGSRPSFAIDNLWIWDDNTIPSTSDYFRSRTSATWNDKSSWESSVNNSAWMNATMVPDYQANSLLVDNGHTITVSTNTTLDQLTIKNGGRLSFTDGTLTINNGSGYDILIEDGGILELSKSTLSFSTGAQALVEGGGIVRVTVGGLTANNSGVNASSFVYEHNSVLEYTSTSSFSASGVTFFPNVNTSTIPVFRVTNITGNTPGGGSPLVVNGILEVNSSFTWDGAGTKTFRNGIRGTGTMTQSTTGKWIINGDEAVLGGTGGLSLGANGLEIASGCSLSVVSDKTISGGTLTNNGIVDLTDYDIDLGSTSQLAGSGKFIASGGLDGRILANKTFTNQAVSSENIGNLGVTLSITGNYTGTITVYRGCKRQTGLYGNMGISRYYDISTTGANTRLDGTLVFSYIDDELNGLNESKLWLYKSFDAGANWVVMSTIRDETANTLAMSGLDGFSKWTGGSEEAILPVELFGFNAKRKEDKVVLGWQTASESKNVGFEVQRSQNARDFEPLGFVDGAGNSNTLLSYHFSDDAPLSSLSYYRLKQTDYNGMTSFSPWVKVEGVSLRPDVSHIHCSENLLHFNVSGIEGTFSLMISDISGRTVFRQQLRVEEGSRLQLPVPELGSGVFILKVSHNLGIETHRFLVE